jgi:hypothetical protein
MSEREYTRADLVLLRSDTGDGGWSLHLRDQEDEEGIPSEILLSGTADLGVGDVWTRPDDRDYNEALMKLRS